MDGIKEGRVRTQIDTSQAGLVYLDSTRTTSTSALRLQLYQFLLEGDKSVNPGGLPLIMRINERVSGGANVGVCSVDDFMFDDAGRLVTHRVFYERRGSRIRWGGSDLDTHRLSDLASAMALMVEDHVLPEQVPSTLTNHPTWDRLRYARWSCLENIYGTT